MLKEGEKTPKLVNTIRGKTKYDPYPPPTHRTNMNDDVALSFRMSHLLSPIAIASLFSSTNPIL